MDHKLKGEWSTRRVWLNGNELRPGFSQSIYNHSPDGFNWGYLGSGPAQLSLALCLELFPIELAKRVYQKIKFGLIALLPQGDFRIEFRIPEDIRNPSKYPIIVNRNSEES